MEYEKFVISTTLIFINDMEEFCFLNHFNLYLGYIFLLIFLFLLDFLVLIIFSKIYFPINFTVKFS